MVPEFISYWWAGVRHRLFCRKTTFCPGHRFTHYPDYPAYARQFGEPRRRYAPESSYLRTDKKGVV